MDYMLSLLVKNIMFTAPLSDPFPDTYDINNVICYLCNYIPNIKTGKPLYTIKEIRKDPLKYYKMAMKTIEEHKDYLLTNKIVKHEIHISRSSRSLQQGNLFT